MSKREDDPQTDLEVGMTTAERRRRRRRGAGLRVPSDNVPRRTTPPVAAPVPEDPSLAMSIAYSFTSDASQPVPVPVPTDGASLTYPDPAVPEPIATVIDPPSGPVEQADFEMNTREMAAVNFESLGLSDLQGRTITDRDAVVHGEPGASDGRSRWPDRAVRAESRSEPSAELDVDIAEVEEATTVAAAPKPPTPVPAPAPAAEPVYRRERLRTVALTDEDLEEVREAVRAMEQTQAAEAASSAAPVGQGVVASPIPPMPSGPMAAVPVPHAPLGATPGQSPLPTAAAAQAPLAQSLAQPHTSHAPLGATSGQSPLTAAPQQAQAAASQSQSMSQAAPHTMPPRPPPTPPHGSSTVARPHTPTPPPPVTARDTRSAAADMWGEDTPVPRPVPQDAPRAEALPRAETAPSVATAPAAAAPTPTPAPRPISFPPPSLDNSNRTMPLSALDLELPEDVRSTEDTGGVPVIDLQGTASGEFEVDVDADDDAEEIPPVAAPAEVQRAHTPSLPPPLAVSSTGQTPVVAPAQPAAAAPAPSGTPSGQHAIVTPGGAGTAAPAAAKDPHHAPAHPPPPPPAALHHHAKPPAPPPAPPQPAKKDGAAKPAAASSSSAPATPRTVTESRQRAKPSWYVEVFDEDYLRTLPFLTPQATQAEAEFVADAMGLTPGQQVLDVGCGYGRHAMELAARGFHVVGLDLSAPLLLRGGEEAQRRNLQINFVRGDMRELDFDSQFDGAYCLFSTFGYFDDETNKRTIASIARALKPGGRILLEILNRDYVIADLPTRVWWEGDGCVVLEEVELNYFSSRIQVNRSVVFDDGRQVEQEISIRAYSLHEVGKLMHAAGFRVIEVSGGYQTRGRFFGNQSRHIIVLAERKEPAAI